MIFRDATVSDLFKIDPQPIQLGGDPRPYISRDATYEDLRWLIARTAEEEGEILASYGLTLTLPGVADAWAVFSTNGLSRGREITEDVAFWLEESIEKFDLRRVQATAYVSHDAAQRWLGRLGFTLEGCLMRFGLNGEDCFIYGRIR